MSTDESVLIPRLPVDEERHCFHDWEILYQTSHILHSMCNNKGACKPGQPDCCELCFYEHTLVNLPHMPEMVFPKNRLVVRNRRTGAQLEFNALDALLAVRVDPEGEALRVACSSEWRETRPQAQVEPATDGSQVRMFDWTYSTKYQGTLSGASRLEPTDERLNLAKLMQQEHIEFYQDVTLYEDELHDHGISSCSVKIRVMPSGFFILLRYFLRIDNVLVRINDTRFHYALDNPGYILKEFSSKEAKVDQLARVPRSLFTVPSEIEKHLPVLQKTHEKIFIEEAVAE